MSTEHPGMVISMGKLMFPEKNLAQRHLCHQNLFAVRTFDQLRTKFIKNIVNNVGRADCSSQCKYRSKCFSIMKTT
jgi:hypothetical protein